MSWFMGSLNFNNTKLRFRATPQPFWAFSKSPRQWEQWSISSWEQCVLTRYASSKGYETDGVDTILEVNEAAQVASDISDHGSDNSDGGNRNDEGGVSVSNALISINNKLSLIYSIHMYI